MENLEVRLAELNEQMKVANHRIQDLETDVKKIESIQLAIKELTMSVNQFAKEMVNLTMIQQKLLERVEQLEKKPNEIKAGKFDKYLGQIVSLVLGSLIGYLLFSLFGI